MAVKTIGKNCDWMILITVPEIWLLDTSCCFVFWVAVQLLRADADVLLRPLLPLLTSGSEEAVIEAARAVSNLARGSAAVQAALLHARDPDSYQCAQVLLTGACAEPNSQTADRVIVTAAVSCYEELAGETTAAVSTSNNRTSPSSKGAAEGSLAGPYLLQALVLLLAHSSWEVVYNVAGALLNLTAAPGATEALDKVRRGVRCPQQAVCCCLQNTARLGANKSNAAAVAPKQPHALVSTGV